jgi:hypothetical protein
MRLFRIAALGAFGLLFAGEAQALTISNMDAKPHTVTVTAGSDSKQLTVEPAKQADADCASGCKVKLENGEEYELKGGETVSIDGNVMFVDSSPDASTDGIPNIDPDAPPPAPPAQQ